jgi:hypothetical protein
MLKLVEFALLAVSLLIILTLVVAAPQSAPPEADPIGTNETHPDPLETH